MTWEEIEQLQRKAGKCAEWIQTPGRRIHCQLPREDPHTVHENPWYDLLWETSTPRTAVQLRCTSQFDMKASRVRCQHIAGHSGQHTFGLCQWNEWYELPDLAKAIKEKIAMNTNNDDTLSIRKDRVLEAAKGCKDAERVLKTIFPEAFAPMFQAGDFVTSRAINIRGIVLSEDNDFPNETPSGFVRFVSTKGVVFTRNATDLVKVSTLSK